MSEITLFETEFYRHFQCWGDQCPSNCCHSWRISVDKKCFKRLRKYPDPIVKNLANAHFKRDNNTQSNYGFIQLGQDRRCPMQDAQGWCEIHKRCGHKALPVTCQLYPRQHLRFGQRVEASLNLSCPAAAQLVLTNPESMLLSSRQTDASQLLLIGGVSKESLPEWAGPLRDFCFDLILMHSLTIETRLYILGLALKQSEPLLTDLPRLSHFLGDILQMAEQGEFNQHFEALPELAEVKWRLFAEVDCHLVKTINQARAQLGQFSPQDRQFLLAQQPLLQAIRNPEQPDWDETFDTLCASNPTKPGVTFTHLINKLNNQYLRPFNTENPQVELNYLLYSIYHNQFLIPEGKTPFQFFKALMVDRLMINAYLCGLAYKRGGMTEQTLIHGYSAYATQRQHSFHFLKTINTHLEKVEAISPMAIFALLK